MQRALDSHSINFSHTNNNSSSPNTADRIPMRLAGAGIDTRIGRNSSVDLATVPRYYEGIQGPMGPQPAG